MSRYITIFCLFFSIATFAQQLGIEDADLIPVIFENSKSKVLKGKLSNYSASVDSDLQMWCTIFSPEFRSEQLQVIPVKEDGSFQLEIKNEVPNQMVWLYVGQLYFGKLIVNDTLDLYLDLGQLRKDPVDLIGKGVSMKGTDGPMNAYLANYGKYKTKNKNAINKEKFNILMNRTAQIPYKMRQLEENYAKFNKIDKAFYKKYGSDLSWIIKDERRTEYLLDIISIYLGNRIDQKVWKEINEHTPQLYSQTANQFYDLLGYHLSNHSVGEIRALNKKVYLAAAQNNAQKDSIDRFLVALDKHNAGISYDKEMYQYGMDNYVSKLSSEIENSKFDLFMSKLEKVDEGKKGICIIKAQPNEIELRKKYISDITNKLPESWVSFFLSMEIEEEENWVRDMTSKYKYNSSGDALEHPGKLITELPAGAQLYLADVNNGQDLIRKIRKFASGKAVLFHFWTTWSEQARTDLRRSLALVDRINRLPVLVVNICVGQNTSLAEWESALVKDHLGAMHFYVDMQIATELMEQFRINQFPAYALFYNNNKFDPYLINGISKIDMNTLEKAVKANME